MRFFRRRASDNESHSPPQEASITRRAFDYFVNEKIVCSSYVDEETIELIYKALKEDNYDTVNDTNLVDAISSLDANIYHLCRALVFQNFMLMRKVDKLSKRIDEITTFKK